MTATLAKVITSAGAGACVLLVIGSCSCAAPVAARSIESYSPGVSVPSRAPTAPPLTPGTEVGSGATTASGIEDASPAPASAGDPLTQNGLVSPLCQEAGVPLPGVGARNCQTSDFQAAAAPTANYGFDVHAAGSVFGLSTSMLLQEYVVVPVWMTIVWVVHTLVVAFEWCFTVDPLDTGLLASVGRALRTTQATFTQPWLRVSLVLAALLALYRSVVRREIVDTLGQLVVMATMMIAGLWVMTDPVGTVGLLSRWADQASLGTLGAVTEGTPARSSRTLAEAMGMVFTSAIGEPWCYLEFGDVGWCRDPSRLDPALRRVSQRLAIGPRDSRLVREARTNGELFLAFPANRPARNLIGGGTSLLTTLCGQNDLTGCRGPTAAVAEFRTQSGTYARLEGLVMIGLGVLGMILLLGFIAMHLLGSGITSLLYLLLAPAAVLAPACGERGRAIFRTWLTHLLAAVTAKLLYSFLLGVVLLLTRILTSLDTPGWWTRWLLLSALWWGAFHHRHRALGLVGAPPQPVHRAHEKLGRVLGAAVPRSYEIVRAATQRGRRLPAHPPTVKPRPRTAEGSRMQAADSERDKQPSRFGEHEFRSDAFENDPVDLGADGPIVTPSESQLAQYAGEHSSAETDGEARPNYAAMQTSPIMRDFFEFAEGRKDHLGCDPPQPTKELL